LCSVHVIIKVESGQMKNATILTQDIYRMENLTENAIYAHSTSTLSFRKGNPMHLTIIATRVDFDEVHCKFVGEEMMPHHCGHDRLCLTMRGYQQLVGALICSQEAGPYPGDITLKIVEQDFEKWQNKATG
jgi:hypothetical protein